LVGGFVFDLKNNRIRTLGKGAGKPRFSRGGRTETEGFRGA